MELLHNLYLGFNVAFAPVNLLFCLKSSLPRGVFGL